jgi:hypothetical protein
MILGGEMESCRLPSPQSVGYFGNRGVPKRVEQEIWLYALAQFLYATRKRRAELMRQIKVNATLRTKSHGPRRAKASLLRDTGRNVMVLDGDRVAQSTLTVTTQPSISAEPLFGPENNPAVFQWVIQTRSMKKRSQ